MLNELNLFFGGMAIGSLITSYLMNKYLEKKISESIEFPCPKCGGESYWNVCSECGWDEDIQEYVQGGINTNG